MTLIQDACKPRDRGRAFKLAPQANMGVGVAGKAWLGGLHELGYGVCGGLCESSVRVRSGRVGWTVEGDGFWRVWGFG